MGDGCIMHIARVELFQDIAMMKLLGTRKAAYRRENDKKELIGLVDYYLL